MSTGWTQTRDMQLKLLSAPVGSDRVLLGGREIGVAKETWIHGVEKISCCCNIGNGA